jgi:hypothetical protein
MIYGPAAKPARDYLYFYDQRWVKNKAVLFSGKPYRSDGSCANGLGVVGKICRQRAKTSRTFLPNFNKNIHKSLKKRRNKHGTDFAFLLAWLMGGSCSRPRGH